MPSKSEPEGSESAAEWTTSPDIDGYTWELGPGPTDDDPTPDDVLDRLAEEAEAQSLYEHGNLPL